MAADGPAEAPAETVPSGGRPAVGSQADQAPAAARRAIREGRHCGPTPALAPGFAQMNLVVVPDAWADPFEAFCRANEPFTPVLEVLRRGERWPRKLAPGGSADVATDVPAYRLLEAGQPELGVPSLEPWWDAGLASFLLGCSFTFDAALVAAGLAGRHREAGRNVPMYRTDRPTRAAGPFGGVQVVSLRPMPREQVQAARELSAAYPSSHGAPVHVGEPAALGIGALDAPDFGDPPRFEPGDVPMFWACGVTALAAVRNAGLAFAATHEPGHMFVSDLRHEALRADARPLGGGPP